MATITEIQDKLNLIKTTVSGILLRVQVGTGYAVKNSELTMIEMDENFELPADAVKDLADASLEMLDLISAIETGEIDPEDIQEAVEGEEYVMSANLDMAAPTDNGAYIWKNDATARTLFFKENLTSNKYPTGVIITTAPGAGEILLANHGSNQNPIEFRYKGGLVDRLPGDGHHQYGFLKRPGVNVYDLSAIGAEPYLFVAAPADPIAIVSGSVSRYASTQNDRTADPLQIGGYNLSRGALNNPLMLVWAFGTGGSAADIFGNMDCGGETMTEIFRSLAFVGTFKKCLQVWALNDADLPADGSITIDPVENGTTVQSNRAMGVIMLENANQTYPSLLSVTDDDSTEDDRRYSTETNGDADTLNLAGLVGEFLALSIFVSGGGTPLTSDGQNVDAFSALNYDVKISMKSGADQAVGFSVASAASGHYVHHVFAVEKEE